MAENRVVIGATLKADGSQANETVKSFKAQLREAQQELIKVQDEFGALSPKALEAAKRIAEMKDQLEEAREVSDLFDPGKKFEAFAGAASVVAAGLSAAQGAMALFGVESEETEKALLKVQAAMALSQGLSTIADGAKHFERLGIMVKSSTVFIKANDAATKAAAFTMKLFGGSVDTTATSFKVLKGAIAATGIGVLLLLVGEAVSLFNEMTTAAQKAAQAQKEAFDTQSKLIEAGLKAEMEGSSRREQLELSRAKARGATEKEMFDLQQGYQRDRIASLKRAIAEETGNETKRKEMMEQLAKEEVTLEINKNNYLASVNQKAADDQKKNNDASIAEAKRRKDELTRQKQAELDAAKKLNEEIRKENEVNYAGSEESSELVRLRQEYDDKAAVLQAGSQSLLNLEAWYHQQKYDIEQKYRGQAKAKQLEDDQQRLGEMAALDQQIQRNLFKRLDAMADTADKEQQIDKATHENKVALVEATGSILGQLSGIIGDHTAVGKGLALGQVAIDTGVAISALTRNSETNPANAATFGSAGAVQFAVGLARILANVAKAKQIISAAPGVKGGGGSSINLSAGSTTAPLKPQLPQTTTTSLDQGTINAIGNQAIRAFVLETDVSSQQSKIREINRRARIG